MDYANCTDPIAGFSDYYAHSVAFINCIDIDGNQPTFWNSGGNHWPQS